MYVTADPPITKENGLAKCNLATEKAHKENPHKEFQRESGRGSGRKVSGPELFMLVSFFPAKYSAIKNFKGRGSQGPGGGGSKVRFSGSFLYVYVLFRCLSNFLTRNGLRENYVMTRKSNSPDMFLCMIFFGVGEATLNGTNQNLKSCCSNSLKTTFFARSAGLITI